MECFNIYPPCAQLAPYILYYWALSTGSGVCERTIPFGNLQLIFHREERIFSSPHNELQPRAFISGMCNHYSDLTTTGQVSMLVVAFRPEGARAFLRLPLNLLHNSNIALDSLGDVALNELSKQVCNQPDDAECIRLLETFFLKRLAGFDTFNFKRLLPAIQAINHQNEIDIAHLPSTACLSYKQFNRVFAEYIGSTPKEFQRIIRFQRTLFILQNHPGLSLTELTYRAGYYDQSHLIKDFKQFSGYTPSEFLQVCAPASDYFTHL